MASPGSSRKPLAVARATTGPITTTDTSPTANPLGSRTISPKSAGLRVAPMPSIARTSWVDARPYSYAG